MVSRRTRTALGGVALGLLVSVAAWYYFETILVVLFLPLVPFLFRWGRRLGVRSSAAVRHCPRCSFRTSDPAYEYCPRDGSRLQERE